MKLTGIILLAGFLQVSARGSAQTVTYQGEAVPLTQVFSVLEKQTGYVFFYNSRDLEGATPVTVNLRNEPLENALKAILAGQALRFIIKGNTILITRPSSTTVLQSVDSLPHPPGDIHGRVTNAQGQPLSGANIIIKRTKRGTETNANGEFSLRSVRPDDILIISFIGYKIQTVAVAGAKDFPLVMQEAKNELDKVVIQAYGTTTERLNTGNIATVTAEEIERQPIMNPLMAMEGKVPGVIITPTSGYASAPIKVEIRGRSTLANINVDPLYIIDGVPLVVLDLLGDSYAGGSPGFTQSGNGGPAGGQSPFFSINPQDIESITVLKDADATAIYGSRGANGVILITTKKGKAGKAKLNIKAYNGYSKVTRFYSMLNTQQYLSMRREAYANDSVNYGITLTNDVGNDYDILQWDSTRYTNWQKYNWGGMGKTNDVQIDLSGGDKQNTFRISGGYHRETDILTVSGANQRMSVQSNISHLSADQKLNLSFTNFFSYAKLNLLSLNGYLAELSPNAPAPFDSKGKLNWSGWNPNYYVLSSDFSNLLNPYSSNTLFLNSQINGKYQIVKGFYLSCNLGYSTNYNSGTNETTIAAQNPFSNPKGSADFRNTSMARWIVEPNLEYNGFISHGKIDILVGGSEQKATANANYVYGYGYTNDNLLQSIANAAGTTAGDGSGQYRYAAVFGRINYNWEDKYILNLSARRDGSSRFGPGKQFGDFGSVGAAWLFSQENWFNKTFSFISFGKLRASYGITGSDAIGDYGFLTRWSAASISPYQGGASFVPLQHANPDLQWQVNKKLEAAIVFGVLKDNINIELVRYRNRTGNQLVTSSLPSMTGFSSVSSNSPALVQNAGWEATLRAKIINTNNFSFNLNFNIGINRNKLISFPNLANSIYKYTYIEGQPLNISQLLHYTGVDPQTGHYTFTDKNHDGQIDPYASNVNNDLFVKNGNENFSGGFGADFSYKGWQINLFFHYLDKPLAPQAIYDGSTLPGMAANQPVNVLNHWQKPGDHAQFARYTTVGDQTDYNFIQFSDGILGNGSFVRLQNLSISYILPSYVIKRAGFQTCRIYVQGENLFLISKYEGPDPEITAFGAMPLSKIITGGIQISF